MSTRIEAFTEAPSQQRTQARPSCWMLDAQQSSQAGAPTGTAPRGWQRQRMLPWPDEALRCGHVTCNRGMAINAGAHPAVVHGGDGMRQPNPGHVQGRCQGRRCRISRMLQHQR